MAVEDEEQMRFWQRRRLAAGRLGPVIVVATCLLGFLPAAQARADAASGLNDFRSGRFSEAYQSWRDAADQGDAVAALYLGVLYDTGFGVATDYRQALDWYRRAASAGNATAMFNTGVMFDAGRGTASDPAQAATWYRRAAARRYGRAEYDLAMMYEAGSGVGRNRAEAIRLFRDAAQDGIAAARGHLAQLGERAAVKLGTATVDPASANFADAQRLLLTRGADEMSRAVILFRRSAEQGNPLAAYNLAYCYEHGMGVGADQAQALAWYRRSAAGAGNTPVKDIAEAGIRMITASSKTP